MTASTTENNLVPNVFPEGMKNSEIILQDEDGKSVITQLDELSRSASEQNFASINIEDSKDVIIGPVTQFNGPVTIYQNVKNGTNGSLAVEDGAEKSALPYQNGKLGKSESTSSDAFHTPEKQTKTSILYSKHLKYLGIPVLLIIISLIILLSVILSRQKSDSGDFPPYQDDSDYTDVDGNLKPIGRGTFIPRSKWNGLLPSNGTRPLHHPTPLVIIAHTATPMCKTFVDCSNRVRSIQNYQIDTLKYLDIGYNFLIGGDANIYVGRGWDIKNVQSSNSVSISFIGNYVRDYLTEDMIKSAKSLIQEGVEKAKLADNYTVICHNQTYNTLSPGSHVYEVVKRWPHFDPSSYIINEK